MKGVASVCFRSHFHEVWKADAEAFQFAVPMFSKNLNESKWEYPTDALFIQVLPVPPPKMRPVRSFSYLSPIHVLFRW